MARGEAASDDGEAEHGVMLRGRLSWQGRRMRAETGGGGHQRFIGASAAFDFAMGC